MEIRIIMVPLVEENIKQNSMRLQRLLATFQTSKTLIRENDLDIVPASSNKISPPTDTSPVSFYK